MKQPNRVKAAMRAGRKAYGYNLSFPSPWVIDILGKLDFDFVFIDGEHGPFGLDQLEDLCRTAERHNVTPIARVPDIGSSTILRYLDRGIMGILGPHIATEADARQLARACYFGPLGERSFGANRGTDYNAGIADKAAYYREANEQTLVCALLEDVAVLDNLDAILSVQGIDLYSIGPNDFAQSLGYPGQPDVGQRYAARCGSPYSIIVKWLNAAVRSDIASKRAGTSSPRVRRCYGAVARGFGPDGAM
jgi:2-keto-3-deoxy-L-rhamnonate aldolase RhmA